MPYHASATSGGSMKKNVMGMSQNPKPMRQMSSMNSPNMMTDNGVVLNKSENKMPKFEVFGDKKKKRTTMERV